MNSSITCVGLKCDTPNCEYRDDTINHEDYEQYIDARCPECGASLLTQADYDAVQAIFELVDTVDALFPAKEGDQLYSMEINLDGSGIPTCGDVHEN